MRERQSSDDDPVKPKIISELKKQKTVSAYKSIRREINLNEFQVHVTWEIFNVKNLVLMFAYLIKTCLESCTLCNTSIVLHSEI